jgi:hypothetical protein
VRCPQCDNEVNPTLVYCSSCGVPLDVDVTDVIEDEHRRREETRIISAVREAKGLLVLGLFSLAVVIALRALFLDKRTYDEVPSMRVPFSVVEEAGIDPPAAVPIEPMPIPIPETR